DVSVKRVNVAAIVLEQFVDVVHPDRRPEAVQAVQVPRLEQARFLPWKAHLEVLYHAAILERLIERDDLGVPIAREYGPRWGFLIGGQGLQPDISRVDP